MALSRSEDREAFVLALAAEAMVARAMNSGKGQASATANSGQASACEASNVSFASA